MDGEITALDDQGKPDFKALLFRQCEPRFVAFDLLYCDGQGFRCSPLTECKHKLRSILPNSDCAMYCDHVERDGEKLFQLACDNDLEGIVAKRKFDPYIPNQASWLKIRNRIIRNGSGERNCSTASEVTIPT